MQSTSNSDFHMSSFQHQENILIAWENVYVTLDGVKSKSSNRDHHHDNAYSNDIAMYSSTPLSQFLLHNIHGYVCKGSMTAVVGASRSGKTMLLRTISNRLPNYMEVSGNIISCEYGATHIKNTEHMLHMGYVPTEDLLLGVL